MGCSALCRTCQSKHHLTSLLSLHCADPACLAKDITVPSDGKAVTRSYLPECLPLTALPADAASLCYGGIDTSARKPVVRLRIAPTSRARNVTISTCPMWTDPIRAYFDTLLTAFTASTYGECSLTFNACSKLSSAHASKQSAGHRTE
jgi:hypothetical protein